MLFAGVGLIALKFGVLGNLGEILRIVAPLRFSSVPASMTKNHKTAISSLRSAINME